MNYFIDTHCHLYMDNFNKDRDETIKRAIDNGVKQMICIGVDLPSSEKCLELSQKYNSVYATAGIHPHEAEKAPSNYLKELEQFYNHEKIVAVGEIGLDFHYNFSSKNKQVKVFQEQLELAKSVKLPAVVHSRNSDVEILDNLISSNHRLGVIHCFSGTTAYSKKILEYGFNISLTGMITFKNSLEEVIKQTPIKRIMLETDAPFLTPRPDRGKRNEPFQIKRIAEKIASIKNISIEEVANETTKNAKKFFFKIK
mgnify:CR=1 FL=1